jgi:hypothetical protein
MTFFEALPSILLSIAVVSQARWISNLSGRINKLERVNATKQWLDAIESGESPSDLAYMREKGFLK